MVPAQALLLTPRSPPKQLSAINGNNNDATVYGDFYEEFLRDCLMIEDLGEAVRISQPLIVSHDRDIVEIGSIWL